MKDKISSLFDNEYSEKELDSLIDDITKKKNHQKNWSYYQITRDVLNGNYVTSSSISEKIMTAIDKEPTQVGGFVQNSSDTASLNFNYLPHIFALSVTILIGFTFLNSPSVKTSNPPLLVQD